MNHKQHHVPFPLISQSAFQTMGLNRGRQVKYP